MFFNLQTFLELSLKVQTFQEHFLNFQYFQRKFVSFANFPLNSKVYMNFLQVIEIFLNIQTFQELSSNIQIFVQPSKFPRLSSIFFSSIFPSNTLTWPQYCSSMIKLRTFLLQLVDFKTLLVKPWTLYYFYPKPTASLACPWKSWFKLRPGVERARLIDLILRI